MKKSSKTKKAWIVTLCVALSLVTTGTLVYAASSYFGNKYKQTSYDDILYRSEWNNLMDDLDKLECPAAPEPTIQYQNPDRSNRSYAPTEGSLYKYNGDLRGSIAEIVRGSEVFGETYHKDTVDYQESLKLKNWCQKDRSLSRIPGHASNLGNLCVTLSTKNCTEYTASAYYTPLNGNWRRITSIKCIHPNTNQYAVLGGVSETLVSLIKY